MVGQMSPTFSRSCRASWDVLCSSTDLAFLAVLFGGYRRFKFLGLMFVKGEGRQPGARWWPPALVHKEGQTCVDDKDAYK